MSPNAHIGAVNSTIKISISSSLAQQGKTQMVRPFWSSQKTCELPARDKAAGLIGRGFALKA
jgi:hypothetical protein